MPYMPGSEPELPRVAVVGPNEVDEFTALDRWGFPFASEAADPGPDLACLEWDRSWAAYLPATARAEGPTGSPAPPVGPAGPVRAERLAGIHSVYTLDLPVPGGSVDCAGLTWVSVHPGDRRRGVLTAMIRAHLNDTHDRGEPVSALHASEATIYGRFGYGIASQHLLATLPRAAGLRDVPGADRVSLRFEQVDLDRHADLVGDCYEAARRSRPGMVSRNSPAQRRRRLADPPQNRTGAESLRILIAEAEAGSSVARGYALFQRTGRWAGKRADGTVAIKELVARDPAAARALWGRMLDLDLMTTIEADARSTDDPLFRLLIDPRPVAATLVDGLWVRLVDLPSALAARRYSAEVDVVLEVSDVLCPWNAGRWRLTGGPGFAECKPSSDPAVCTLDVRELGAAYLGSTSLDSLATAGLLAVHDPARFATASRAFSWPVAAYCGWMF